MGYQKLGIPISFYDAKLIIKRLDHDRDGLLTYTEVCDIFVPKDKIVRNSFIERNDECSITIKPSYLGRIRNVFQ